MFILSYVLLRYCMQQKAKRFFPKINESIRMPLIYERF
ncbi:hypothetical protein SD78_2396 [Bacillus badius]|nr:hypothetical protein SD78_2396 [Bacillus badius]